MSFKKELRKALNVDKVVEYLAENNDLEPFITSIINLVDKEVIGEDTTEDNLIEGLKNTPMGLAFMTGRNALRAEQRNNLRGE